MEPKKEHLLRRRVKKVLIPSRQTIGHRYMVPNTRRFADCIIWLKDVEWRRQLDAGEVQN